MVQISSVALHFSAVCAMTYGYNAYVRRRLEPLNSQSIPVYTAWQLTLGSLLNMGASHFQFLTIQGLAVAWITMVLGLVEDFFPWIQGIKAAKRTLFIAAMPIATIVSSIYWTLLLTFPHLILQAMPADAASSVTVGLPLRIDLALHAVPCLALLADFMIFERRYGRKAIIYVAPPVALVCTVWYGWWVEHCASKNGTFPYPFLTLNPIEIRLRIYAGAGILACLSFYALNALHPKSR